MRDQLVNYQLIGVNVSYSNGTTLSGVTVNPDGTLIINNVSLPGRTPINIKTQNGSECYTFFGTLSYYTIRYSVIASIFSQVDPVFFNIYRLMNGEGSRGDQNVTTFNQNSSELDAFYADFNRTIQNMTVKLFLLN